ncbi:ankyrin repeat and KH domain-containing protein mask-like [Haliotis rubra]|uniref:ankyrin repeat and KH domain-containing protein mask-like n=1 Tax=Haliotis rubra TaxID=36100 RepID=UPI001EE532ED|nr:ankyrin repeat and KH domain-containing protein mask-like [Haliotis rubra]
MDGWTPVMQAASEGHKDVFDVLVKAGTYLSQVSNNKQTILHLACRGGNTEIIKYLLKHTTVDIDSRDASGWTPVMQAAIRGHKDAFDVLVESGADLSQVSNNKETILHMACGVGNVDIIMYLLKHDIVEINSQGFNGLTPVMRAAKYGHKDVFDVLVKAGADLSRLSDRKETTLHVACTGGNVGIIKYLLKHDIVDIDSRDVDGWTPVMHTVTGGRKDVFDLLVKWSADLSLLDYDNDNILHLACEGDVEIVKYLLTLNMFDINSRDGDDCTSVMIAARWGHEAIFFLLVENEADLTIMNGIGDNILDMACEGENVHIVKYASTRHIVEGPYREDDPC